MADFETQFRDYRLITAEILYRLPDYPSFLQSYIWQDYDLPPKFPVLYKFLKFWERELDGPIHSVTMDSAKVITPGHTRFADTEFTLQ
jgi:uncharacterized protein Usg